MNNQISNNSNLLRSFFKRIHAKQISTAIAVIFALNFNAVLAVQMDPPDEIPPIDFERLTTDNESRRFFVGAGANSFGGSLDNSNDSDESLAIVSSYSESGPGANVISNAFGSAYVRAEMTPALDTLSANPFVGVGIRLRSGAGGAIRRTTDATAAAGFDIEENFFTRPGEAGTEVIGTNEYATMTTVIRFRVTRNPARATAVDLSCWVGSFGLPGVGSTNLHAQQISPAETSGSADSCPAKVKVTHLSSRGDIHESLLEGSTESSQPRIV